MSDSSNMNLDRMESWRTLVEGSIQEFFTTLPAEVRVKLDYSVDSLDSLEAWLIGNYAPSESNPNAANSIIPNGAMYYIGETIRKNLGGYWNVHFAEIEPNYRYGEDPVIEGFFQDMAHCPWVLIKTTLEKRTGKYLSGVLRLYILLYIYKGRLPR